MNAPLPRAFLSWPSRSPHESLPRPPPIAYPIGAPWSVRSPGRGSPFGELSTVAYRAFRLCHLFFCGGAFLHPSWPSVLVQGYPLGPLKGPRVKRGRSSVVPSPFLSLSSPFGSLGLVTAIGPTSLPKDVLLKGCSCQIPVGLQSTCRGLTYCLLRLLSLFLPSSLSTGGLERPDPKGYGDLSLPSSRSGR